jgi:hypothetical protein
VSVGTDPPSPRSIYLSYFFLFCGGFGGFVPHVRELGGFDRQVEV